MAPATTKASSGGSTLRPRARRLAPEARRAQLLECAVGAFARRGIGSAAHSDVAEAAGVSVPTVFVYFPTRKALLEAVLDEVARLYRELAERVHAVDRPAPALLLAHARAFGDSVDVQPDHARVWLEWSSTLRAEIWPRYLELEKAVLAILVRTLERGQREGSIVREIAPGDGARIAVGAGHMIAQMKLSGHDAPSVERFEEAMVRALAGGLARGAAGGG